MRRPQHTDADAPAAVSVRDEIRAERRAMRQLCRYIITHHITDLEPLPVMVRKARP